MGMGESVWHVSPPPAPQRGWWWPWDCCRLLLQELPLLSFSSRPNYHLVPRPLPAFLLCQVVHSHVSQRTTNSIKLDQIHGGLGAEGEQRSVWALG